MLISNLEMGPSRPSVEHSRSGNSQIEETWLGDRTHSLRHNAKQELYQYANAGPDKF